MTRNEYLSALYKALKSGVSSEDERRDLRALLTASYDMIHPTNASDIRTSAVRAYANSPYIGDDPNQIKPRPSFVGFRDAFSVHVLQEILLEIGEVVLAQDTFDLTCVATVASSISIRMEDIAIGECFISCDVSKTGWVLGARLTSKKLEDARTAFLINIWNEFGDPPNFDAPPPTTPTATGDSMNPDMLTASLDQLINSHDVFIRDNEDEWVSNETLSGNFVQQMRDSAETSDQTDRVEAFEASLSARALTSDEEIVYSDAIGDELSISIADAVTKALAGTDDDSSDESGEVEIPKITVKSDFKPVLDTMLSNATSGGLKDSDDLVEKIRDGMLAMREADELRKKIGTMSAPAAPVAMVANGDIPEGEVEQQVASKVFDIKRGKAAFKFEIPVFKWATPHPHVPVIDPDYIFQPMALLNLLQALVNGERSYIVGHTGTGKTTMIEQTLARMNWPMIRINFDSEITRMDLMGRDVLMNDGGVTTSKFVDGVLPTALSGPYVLVCDEIDRIRAEVSYVFNRMLEGNGLLITEDGGRFINAHPMSRLVANANTVGQGDDHGLYQGARPQSQAFLDRFTRWMNLEYLKQGDEKKLLMSRAPGLPERFADAIMRYVKEHREAFVNAEVLQPLSPRSVIGLGQTLTNFLALMPDEDKAGSEAFQVVILNRASPQDRAVLKGIHNRVWTVAKTEAA